MGNFPDHLKRLIEHFDQQSDQVRLPDYNETKLRIDFVNPLFAALGWDVDNSQHFAEQYREVVHEDRVKVAGQTKAPDYSFRVGGVRKFFLEAKKPAVKLKDAWEPAYQLRRYGWSAKLPVSLLTNFEELAIYDCRIAPKQFDKPATARREYMTYREYADRWDFLEGIFSKRAVLQGDFDRYCQAARGRGRQEFDDTFLEEIEEWRKNLAANLALRNDNLDEPGLNFAVQRIIDRIIFLRMAEDRGTEPTGQLQALLSGEETYARLQKLFRDADARYNSGLFHFNREKGRDESPDTLTPVLEIDDRTLKEIIDRLYYPKSPYEFTVVTADILGSVYERFLGKVITLTPGHRAKIEEKPEVRKAGGVYYTPTYIVDYIVRNTVGNLIEKKTQTEARKLKILDPACGSGSFLIGAYQFLLDWHLTQYTATNPQALATGKTPVLRPTDSGGWKLTISERKRILLDNIHGVDLDAAAVEVTKLNLLLKCLEGETSQTLNFQHRIWHDRALPDLGHNILCGNSLIGTDIMSTDGWAKMADEEKRRINPFDYERSFAEVFKQGGFDAVIGNPPYLAGREWDPELWAHRPYFLARFSCMTDQYDLYALFVQRAIDLLQRKGAFGFITPNTWLNNEHYLALRKWVCEQVSISIIGDFRDVKVFSQATVLPVVIVAFRGGPKDGPTRVDDFKSATAWTSHETSVALWHKFENFAINLSLSTCDSRVLDRIQRMGWTISDVAETRFGVKVYQIGKGHPPQKGPESAKRLFESDRHKNKQYFPYLRGEDVSRYSIRKDSAFLRWGVHLAEPRSFQLFEGSRILVRRIVGARLIMAPIETVAIADQLLHTVKLLPNATCDYRFVAACLGSSVTAYYFRKRYNRTEKTFPEIRVAELSSLPLPDWEAHPKQHAAVVSLVDRIVLLGKTLTVERSPSRREQVEREIEATEQQIDKAVYDLYGLGSDEVRIIGEAVG